MRGSPTGNLRDRCPREAAVLDMFVLMEFFGWPPGVVEELRPEYQDLLLLLIGERRQAEREAAERVK